jgi:hypothetical protein
MTRWNRHGAALAAWLGLVVAVQAQTSIPTPVGAARMIEPLGYKPDPPPNLVPGPVTPEMAPVGPPDCLSLNAHHTSAFQCENLPLECAPYASIGSQALQRNRLPHVPIVLQESSNIDTTAIPFGPLGSIPELMSLNNINPRMTWGPRVTVGYLEHDQAVEFTGYWLNSPTESRTVIEQGRLFVPFVAPTQGFPIGFEGNNGLWLNADLNRTYFTSQLGSAELNYRSWNSGINRCELILGLRYIHELETVGIYTNDELFVTDILGRSDPRKAATYTVTSRNNIIAGQVGGEYSFPCPVPLLAWMWFTAQGKAAFGPNLVDRTFSLRRGDGLQGFRATRSDVLFGQVYETGAYIDIHLLDRVRIRGGWQAMFLVGVSNAGSQIEFNLNAQGSRNVDYHTQFYHGPTIELQFLF